MARRRGPRKPKRVAYTLLTRADHAAAYQLLADLVAAHHDDLRHAAIALAWCTSWKRDVDGHVTLGKCKKASDLDRELAAFDFVILLARWFWTDETVTDAQRAALLDHELCHAAVVVDPATNDPAVDERGRIVYRLRKHDLEEFACIAERYGTWKRDLELFARALKRSKQQRLPMAPDASTAPPPVH